MDNSLWTEALRGEPRAFAELHDRYYDRVFRHVVGITDQSADADEVTASTFFELWRRRNHVRLVNQSVLPWLLVTAGNLARNHGRKTARYRALLRRLPRDPDWTDPVKEFEDADETSRRAAQISKALARLGGMDAQLVALHVEGDLSLADSAAALGISANSARVRMHRLRRRLQAELLTPNSDAH